MFQLRGGVDIVSGVMPRHTRRMQTTASGRSGAIVFSE